MNKTNVIFYYTLTKVMFLSDRISKLNDFFDDNIFKRFQQNPHSSISVWVMISNFFKKDILTEKDLFSFALSIDFAYNKLKKESFDLSDFDEFNYTHNEKRNSFRSNFIDLFTDIQIEDSLISTYEDYKTIMNDEDLKKLLHLIWAFIPKLEDGLIKLNDLEKFLIFAEVGLPKPKNNNKELNTVPEMVLILKEARSRVINYRCNITKMINLFNALKYNHDK